jgi:hypothetical protein
MSNLSPDSPPDWSDEELLLLRSAKDDRPPPDSLAATLAAVGVGAAVASSAAAAQAAMAVAGKGASTGAAGWIGSIGSIGAAKWVSVAMIAGAITVGGVAVERHALRTKLKQQEVRAAARAPTHVSGAPAAPEQTAAALTEAMPAAAPAVVAAPPLAIAPIAPAQQAHPRTSARKEPPAAAPAQSQPDLTHEIASLDAARAALRRGAANEALQALDRYDAEHALKGSLQLEAGALRIEALFSRGDRALASKLARSFLARHPKSPYAAAIRKLLAPERAAP